MQKAFLRKAATRRNDNFWCLTDGRGKLISVSHCRVLAMFRLLLSGIFGHTYYVIALFTSRATVLARYPRIRGRLCHGF